MANSYPIAIGFEVIIFLRAVGSNWFVTMGFNPL